MGSGVGRPEKSLPAGGGPLADCATELRKLRRRVGDPPYRQMARRAGDVSASALSSAARGDALPSWRVVAAFVRVCDGDPAEWRSRWVQLEDRLRSEDPPEGADILADPASARQTDAPAGASPAEDPAPGVRRVRRPYLLAATVAVVIVATLATVVSLRSQDPRRVSRRVPSRHLLTVRTPIFRAAGLISR